ncbi:uncharacterized protein TNCV_5025881 [Trichonephila clavipes]|uniref:Uncharacterized protein n=1 Tax=Trichonephila clavipes TaxID=2585209 RepID=A0A8X6RUV6_TRICX|nr:uncharacterized protein TNCV_5025881 [Trichonephila clavipes]
MDGVLAEKAAKIEQEKFKLESERAAKIEQEKFKLESEKAKIEFEKIKLEQLKKKLELTNAKCKLSPAQEKSEYFESVPSDIENLIKSIKTLTIPVPSNTEAYNLFFQSLEKAFKTKNVEDKFKAEILLNMLGEKVGNLMIYVKQEELGDYEKIKQLVLKQFQPTPRVLLNQFRRSQKLPNENYVQFASRIEAMFDYKKQRLCFLCLRVGCMASKCKAKPCKLCAKRHHASLHFPKQNTDFQTSHYKSNAFHPSTQSRLNAEARERI